MIERLFSVLLFAVLLLLLLPKLLNPVQRKTVHRIIVAAAWTVSACMLLFLLLRLLPR
ncbi:MAG: hypothetical protein Q4A49_00030 [Neisseria sp.]|nr:hypothetical protein [Neisseria sp.]